MKFAGVDTNVESNRNKDSDIYAQSLVKRFEKLLILNKRDLSELLDSVKKLCNKIHEGITYQKHMTQHILDKDYEWINSLNNCFLSVRVFIFNVV